MNKKWYLGKLVEYPIIKEKKTNKIINANNQLVWINYILVSAKNSEEAYRKLTEYGKSGNYTTTNRDGNKVTWKFAGINDLVLIYDKLEDLSEIACYEKNVRKKKSVDKLVFPKNKLTVFQWEKEQNRNKLKRSQKN